MRALVLVLALYVTSDFGSSSLPGAFAFDPDESVEAVSPVSFSSEAEAPASLQTTAAWRVNDLPEDAPVLRGLVSRVRPVVIWTVYSTASRRDAPAPADDHQQ
jgi:hypothetical protein